MGAERKKVITNETFDPDGYPLLMIKMKTGFFSKNIVGKAYTDYIVWFDK